MGLILDPRQQILRASIITAMEGNLIEFILHCGGSPVTQISSYNDHTTVITGIPQPSLNVVMRSRLSAYHIEQRITEILTPFKDQHLPVLWYLFPGTQPTHLGRYLVEQGLTYQDEGPGMAVELDRLPPLYLSNGLTIEEVDNAEALQAWIAISSTAFNEADNELDPDYAAFERGLGWGQDQPYRRFLARLHGQPIATSSLFLGSNVVGLYSVSTLPAFRRQGYGSAISLAPLLLAREMHYHIGVLQASPAGYNVYSQLGFYECCHISSYLWTPS